MTVSLILAHDTSRFDECVSCTNGTPLGSLHEFQLLGVSRVSAASEPLRIVVVCHVSQWAACTSNHESTSIGCPTCLTAVQRATVLASAVDPALAPCRFTDLATASEHLSRG